MVSPLAFVHPEAQIGANVEIAPFAVINRNVVIGDNCVIGSNATICEYTRLGNNCQVFPSAVIGAIPQRRRDMGGDRRQLRPARVRHHPSRYSQPGKDSDRQQ